MVSTVIRSWLLIRETVTHAEMHPFFRHPPLFLRMCNFEHLYMSRVAEIELRDTVLYGFLLYLEEQQHHRYLHSFISTDYRLCILTIPWWSEAQSPKCSQGTWGNSQEQWLLVCGILPRSNLQMQSPANYLRNKGTRNDLLLNIYQLSLHHPEPFFRLAMVEK